MKRKKIINIRIRKGITTLALMTAAVIAGITNSSAKENDNVTNINNTIPEFSQTILNDTQLLQRQASTIGLIVDPLTLQPVANISDYFGSNQQWVPVDAIFENRIGPDGNITGRRYHDYKTIDIKEVTNKNGTIEQVTTKECKNCGYTITTKKDIYKPGHGHGQGTGSGGSHGGGSSNGGSSGGNSGSNNPSHTHNWSSWTPISDAEHTRTCITDGCTIKTQTYKHTFGEWSEWSEWTLTTDAEGKQIEYRTRTQSCSDCGYVKSEKQTRPYTPSHTHNWSEWKVTKQATCTEAGEQTRTCMVEGCTIKTETKTIPALGHTYGEWTISQDWHVVTKEDGTRVEQRVLEQTCTVCDDKKTKTEERPYTPGHTHDLRTTTSYENVSIGTGEHKHKVITTITCTGCDYKEVKEAETTGTLSIGKDDNGHYQECSLCHAKTESEAHNYKYTTSGNVSTGICEVCGHTNTHNHTASTVSPEDACSVYTTTQECSACGEEYTIYNGHQLEYIKTNNVTHKELWACACGNLSEERDPEPCEHEWSEWKKVSDTEDSRECSKCNQTETESHTYSKQYDSTNHYDECSKCHDIINSENHNISYTNATGNVVMGSCDNCDYTNTHNHTASTVSPEDACSVYTTTQECSACGEEYTIYNGHQLEYIKTNNVTHKELWACACGNLSEQRDPATNNLAHTSTNNSENEVVKFEESLNDTTQTEISTAETLVENEPSTSITETINEVQETEMETVDSIIDLGTEEIDSIIESGKQEADQVIAEGSSEIESVIEAGNQEVQDILERADAELQERLAESDAAIASLFTDNPLKRFRKRMF